MNRLIPTCPTFENLPEVPSPALIERYNPALHLLALKTTPPLTKEQDDVRSVG